MMPDLIDPQAIEQRPAWESLTLAPIASHPQYINVADYLKTIKAFQKRVTEWFKPHKDRALATHRALCEDERKALEPALADEQACKRLMLVWDSEQERLRREEERRRQDEARKQEEERRLAEAAALEAEAQATGDGSLLDQAMELIEAPIVAPVIAPVEKATPKIVGVSYRENWTFNVTDPTKVPREYLAVDLVKIRGVVRAMKGATKIPGVEVYTEKVVAAGAGR